MASAQRNSFLDWLGITGTVRTLGTIVFAVVTGIASVFGVATFAPVTVKENIRQEVAPDRWYGWQGRENLKMIFELQSFEEELRDRVRKLEATTVLMERHLAESTDGYRRLRQVEKDAEVSKADRKLLWEEVRTLQVPGSDSR